MYSSEDFERLYFQYQMEAVPSWGVSSVILLNE